MERPIRLRRAVTKVLAVAAAVMMMLLITGAAPPASPLVNLVIDGRPVAGEPRPYIEQGRTLVPLRLISEHLNLSFRWDPDQQSITVNGPHGELYLLANNPAARWRGEPVLMDVPPRIVNGRTMVPIRLVAETSGAQVQWDAALRTVSIATNPPGADGAQKAQPVVDLSMLPAGLSPAALQAGWGPAHREAVDLQGVRWLVYNGPGRYLRAGFTGDGLVGLYAGGSQWRLGSVNGGTTIADARRLLDIRAQSRIHWRGNDFTFYCADPRAGQLPVAWLNQRPVLLFVDEAENKIAGALILDIDALMALDPAQVTGCSYQYRGNTTLPTLRPLAGQDREKAQQAEAMTMLDLVNLERSRRGLSILEWNQGLALAALGHSQDMSRNGFVGHQSPSSGGPLNRVLAQGINPCLVVENIAAGFPDAVSAHQALMNSPGHRDNILHPEIRYFGSGVADHHFTAVSSSCIQTR